MSNNIITFSGPESAWQAIWELVDEYVMNVDNSVQSRKQLAMAKAAISETQDQLSLVTAEDLKRIKQKQNQLQFADIIKGKRYKFTQAENLANLRGEICTVIKKNKTRIIVELENPPANGKYGTQGTVTCYPSHLMKIEGEAY